MAPLQPSPDVFLLVVLGGPLLVSLGFTAWVGSGLVTADAEKAWFESARLKSMLLSSRWYGLYTAAVTIALGTGTVIVGSVRGLAEAAVFSIAGRLFSPIISVVAASGSLLWPGMTEAISRGDLAWVRSRYRRGLVSIGVISCALSLALIGIGPWLAELWVGAELVPARSLFVWTAAFTVSFVLMTQASGVLMAVERMRGAAALAVGSAVVSVGTSVVLVGLIGMNGAAIRGTRWMFGRAVAGYRSARPGHASIPR